MPALSLAPVIKANGTALTQQAVNALVSLEVDRGVNLVGRATLRFVEQGFDLEVQPKFTLGTKVTIALNAGGSVFSGEVTGLSLDQGSGYGPITTELTVVVDDPSYKLGKETKNQAFLNQKYSEVLSSFAGDAGLSPEVTTFGDVQEYLLQSGTSLAYLDWVTSRFGMLWWVDDGKLVVKKAGTASSTVSVALGTTLRKLSTRASGLHSGKVTVNGWDVKQQKPITDTASDTVTKEADLFAKFPGRSSGAGTAVAVASSPLTTDEAKAVSAGMLAQSTASAVTARGTCDANGDLAPGVKVTIENAGPASGTYFVTRVQHVYTPTGFDTHFTAGPLQPDTLVDLLGAPPAAPGGSINGLVPALVTDNKDKENWGRVKVKFPSLGSTGGVESAWARVLALGGGKERGIVFHPEINDEVLVGFEGGDTRRPVVLGGLYSNENKLPTTDNVGSDGKTEFRRITSRLGHLVELADGTSPDKQHILLKTKKGHQIRLGEDEVLVETANKPIKITNGNATVSFANNGDITIEGMNITIKADAALKLEGKSGVEIKSSASGKFEAAMLNIKAQGMGTVEAGGIMAVKGATVAIN
jgi:phage baseplate assembly protein gpV